MTRDTDRFRLVLALALLTAFGACSSDGTTAPRKESEPSVTQITTLLISAPSSIAAAGQSQEPTAGEESYTYVSASPGSSPGVTASIANRTRDQQTGKISRIEVSVEDGGFDPVPIPASAGDTLQVEFLSADRSVLLAGATVVPKVRPPKIVRTNPRPGKKDVPLNARFEIVFSEPVDPGTLTPENIKIVAGEVVVAGSLVRTDDFTVELVPAEPLRPETLYQIIIGTGVRNMGGVALESEFTADFETGVGAPATIACPAATQCLTFVRNGDVFTTASNDSMPRLLLEDAFRPAWSPDGLLIAFTRTDIPGLEPSRICIAERDGTQVRCASVGDGRVIAGPSWSADGTQVAFSTGRIKKLDTRTMQVTDIGAANVTSLAWSPDGKKIAFGSWGTGASGATGLHVMNADGSNSGYIGQSMGLYSVSGIAWSPDGGHLGLAVNQDNLCPWDCDSGLAVVNADGTGFGVLATAQKSHQARPEATYIDFPSWSPDGTILMYTFCAACDDIGAGITEVRGWDMAAGASHLLVSYATYGSWRP